MEAAWNAEFKDKFTDIPKSFPKMEVANEMWKQIAPVLVVALESIGDPSEYWARAAEIVSKISGSMVSVSEFPLFVAVIFKSRAVFQPATPENCVPFINCCCPSPANDFFFFDFPRAIGNSALAIHALSLCNWDRNPHWMKFISEQGSAQRFIDLYLPFLACPLDPADKARCDFIVELCSLIVTLVITYFDKIYVVDRVMMYVNQNIVELIAEAPKNVALSLTFYWTRLNRVALPRLTAKKAGKRVMSLFKCAPIEVIRQMSLVTFALKYVCATGLTCSQLAWTLISRGCADMEIIAGIAMHTNSGASTCVIKHLAQVTVTDIVFARSAVVSSMRILRKSPSGSARNWYKQFVRDLAFFIGFCHEGRYEARIASIVEIFVAFINSGVVWLSKAVLNDVMCLLSKNLCPPHFKSLFKVELGEVMSEWMREYRKFCDSDVHGLNWFGLTRHTLAPIRIPVKDRAVSKDRVSPLPKLKDHSPGPKRKTVRVSADRSTARLVKRGSRRL